MKKYTIILLTLITNLMCGQNIYRKSVQVNSSSIYSNEFHIGLDSMCVYSEGYLDNSQYNLVKGTLKKLNDTLYEFKYKPVVRFGCNKRLSNFSKDSIYITIQQIDTTISNLNFKVKLKNANQKTVELINHKATYLKGVSEQDFYIDTKFKNPFTQKIIYMTVDTLSEPELTYYGCNTAFISTRISIINGVLTIYPDKKTIWEKVILKNK